MDNRVTGALKRIIEEVKEKRKAECLNKYCVVNQQIGGNDIDIVESWMKKDVDTINIVWGIEDVMSLREDLTKQEAREILQAVKDNHDASIGVSWDTIQSAIDSFIADRE